MVRCSVLGCRSDSGKKIVGLSFHSFTAKPESRDLWIKAPERNNWVRKQSSKICSQHFHNTSFMRVGNKTYLHPEAIPVEALQSASTVASTSTVPMERLNKITRLLTRFPKLK